MSDLLSKNGDASWFQQDRFGMFIHWGLYAAAARHEWVKNYEQTSDEEYMKYFNHFAPDLYDPKAWARMARQAGMKYFVITAKHHEGFCLWDSQYTDYKAPNTPCGKDLLTPMVDAFREEGLRVGFYYSLLDWHHPEYTTDFRHPARNDKSRWADDEKRDMSKYAEYMRNQVEELLTQFGQIDLLWFDFSFPGEEHGKGRDQWESEKLYDLVRTLQPNILIDNRLDLPGSGDFVTPEQFQPQNPPVDEDGNPIVWEACQTFSGSWGYHRDEKTWKSVPQLLGMLIDGVSKDGNLLLNVGPTARGEFDYRAQQCLAGMGEWMRVHSRSIYGCGAAPKDLFSQSSQAPADCRLTYNAETHRLYVHILAWPFKHLHLPGLAGKVEYAQLLNDASELLMKGPEKWQLEHAGGQSHNTLTLELPVNKPNVEIPVVELFLKS